MARTIPNAHVVNDVHELARGGAIYTTPVDAIGRNVNNLFAKWAPNQTIQCADGASPAYSTEAGAAGFTERFAIRFPVQAGRGNLLARCRLRSVNAPSGAAQVAEARTSSGAVAVASLPATAAAQTFAWYKSAAVPYNTGGTHDYLTIALKANVLTSGDVHMAQFSWSYYEAATLGTGKTGDLIAYDTDMLQADNALAVKHANEISASFGHVHTEMLWPITTLCDDLQGSKLRWSTTSADFVRVIGPLPIPVMGAGLRNGQQKAGVVDTVGFSALAFGEPAADRVTVYVTSSSDNTPGAQSVVDSHSWTPTQDEAGATGTWYRTAANWEDATLTIKPDRVNWLWVEIKGDGTANETRLLTLNAWAAAR
jgi:hypothetical protein